MSVNTVDSQTKVRFTLGQILGALATIACSIVGGIWLVSTFVVSGITHEMDGLRTDVSAIRVSAQNTAVAVQQTDKEGLLRLRDSESKLSDQISGLRTDLAGFRSDLSANTKLVTALADQVTGLRNDIVSRQASLSDPKAAAAFVAALKEAGVDTAKIVVIPWGVAPPK